jgi:hypothetical protein
VFRTVKKYFINGDGSIPNDRINSFDVTTEESGNYCFILLVDSVADDGVNNEVQIKIIAESVGLRNPHNPEVLIVD